MQTHIEKEKAKVVERVSSVICKCLGPNCSKTLISSSTGQALVTSDGMTILNLLYPTHPLAVVVVAAIKKHHQATGDGVKSFLLYLSHALNAIEQERGSLSYLSLNADGLGITSIRISNQLAKIESHILPNIWKMVCDKHIQSRYCVNGRVPVKLLKDVINTVISSHLTRINCGIFVRLVLQVLGISEGKDNELVNIEEFKETLSFMVDNYAFLHRQLPRHLYESSCIVQGVLLQRDFTLKLPFKEPARFVLLQCSVESRLAEEASEILEVKNETQAKQALSHKVQVARIFLTSLKKANIALILCSEKVPNFVVALCRECGISITEFVDEEDLSFIGRVARVQRIFSPFEGLQESQIGTLSNCDSIVCGSQRVVRLQFEQSVHRGLPNTLLLAAPGEGLVDELRRVILKCLKALKACFDFDTSHFLLGFDEDCQNRLRFCTISGGGFFELVVADLLKSQSLEFKDSSVGLGCRILHDCLLSVPRTLHKSLSLNLLEEHRDYTKKLQQMIHSVHEGDVVGFNKRGRICDPSVEGILEPFASKVLAFASMIQLLKQLLRIDCVVSVRRLDLKRSKVKERCNENDDDDDDDD